MRESLLLFFYFDYLFIAGFSLCRTSTTKFVLIRFIIISPRIFTIFICAASHFVIIKIEIRQHLLLFLELFFLFTLHLLLFETGLCFLKKLFEVVGVHGGIIGRDEIYKFHPFLWIFFEETYYNFFTHLSYCSVFQELDFVLANHLD